MQLIVGLGNPGADYDKTRHNAGAWLAEALAKEQQATFRAEKKFHGLLTEVQIDGHACRLLLPTTFMNHSGQAIKAVSQFYKIPVADILVAHDELDLPAGCIKLKMGGGHAGHNGLRDTIQHLGSQDFLRLRIGIGHPGHQDRVLDYVLGRPSQSDEQKIMASISQGLDVLPDLVTGDVQKAMRKLHV